MPRANTPSVLWGREPCAVGKNDTIRQVQQWLHFRLDIAATTVPSNAHSGISAELSTPIPSVHIVAPGSLSQSGTQQQAAAK